MSSKYRSLAEHLRQSNQDMLRMSFDEVNQIVEGDLPQAALDHRAWWANSQTHAHARHGWLNVGYETSDVDLEGREVVFSRATERATMAQVLAAPQQLNLAQAPAARDLRPEKVLMAAGGEHNVSRILQEIERYIYGELTELELGQILRKLWPRAR